MNLIPFLLFLFLFLICIALYISDKEPYFDDLDEEIKSEEEYYKRKDVPTK